MTIFKRFFPLSEPSILFSSFALSLTLAFLTKDALFSFLFLGKSLAGRAISIQVGFLLVYFFLLLLVLLVFLQKPLRWLLSNAHFAFMILALVPLAAHSFIGSFSRFVADDFSSATLAVTKGIPSATWDWYIHWSGRYTASFFDSLAGYLHPSMMRWETGTAIFLLFAGMFWSIGQTLTIDNKYIRFAISALLASTILTACFILAPDLPQSLYWGQGMRSLIFPLIPGAFLVAISLLALNKLDGRLSRGWLFATGVLAFFAGGFGETYVVIQITAFALGILFVWFSPPSQGRNNALSILFTGLFLSLASMAVIIAAPGNGLRQSYFPPSPTIPSLIEIAFASFWSFLTKIFAQPSNSLSMFVIFALGYSIKCLCATPSNSDYSLKPRPHILFSSFGRALISLFFSFFILLFSSFVPSAYGMSTTPPDRTLILPSLILTIFISILGFILASKINIYAKLQNRFTWLKKNIVLWALFFSFVLFTFFVTTDILVVRADYAHFADTFDRADRMSREAKVAGHKSVEVPEVHNYFGLSDYGAGTTYWLDEAVNSYYGLEVIVNKHMK